jgi:hypothetical protein
MEKIKVYVILDKKSGALMSYDNGKEIVFYKKKKDVLPEYGAKVSEAILEIKTKGIDY